MILILSIFHQISLLFLLNQYQSDIRNLEPTPIKNQEYFENVPGASGAIGGGTTYFKNGGKGLWANIHAKRKRIAAGSGEKMRKPGSEGAPTAKALRESKRDGGYLEYKKGGFKSPAWTRKEGQNPSGGLNAKGRASAITTSKLSPFGVTLTTVDL